MNNTIVFTTMENATRLRASRFKPGWFVDSLAGDEDGKVSFEEITGKISGWNPRIPTA